MITAFFLGFMGSLHCAGVCGPLVLMAPVVGKTDASIFISRLLYHAGRVTMYGLIGALFGLLGQSLVFAGFQRWLSITVGFLMIIALVAGSSFKGKTGVIPIAMKSFFGKFLRKRSYSSILALGATNGLLPCGLVYMAATASIATGGIANSILYMFLFGLGTLPMLLTISIAGAKLNLWKVPGLQKLAPAAAAVVAVLLIMRSEPIGLFNNESGRAQCAACRN